MLENVYNHLEINGLFVLDIIDTKNITFNQEIVVEKGNNKQLICYYSSDQKYITADVKALKNGKLLTEMSIKTLIIEKYVLINMLKESGFEILVCSNNINHPNQISKDNLYFVCQKKKMKCFFV